MPLTGPGCFVVVGAGRGMLRAGLALILLRRPALLIPSKDARCIGNNSCSGSCSSGAFDGRSSDSRMRGSVNENDAARSATDADPRIVAGIPAAAPVVVAVAARTWRPVARDTVADVAPRAFPFPAADPFAGKKPELSCPFSSTGMTKTLRR